MKTYYNNNILKEGYSERVDITLVNHFRNGLEKLKAGKCVGLIGEVRVIGGMVGFGVLGQTLDDTKKFLMRLFNHGVVAFYAGHDPYIVRCLPPFGDMTVAEIDLALSLIEKTLLEMKPTGVA